jgi:hypothetical protein
VLRVRDAMLAFDYSKLELRRFPGERDKNDWGYGHGGLYGRDSYSRGYRGYEEDSKAYFRDQHARKNYPGYSAWTGENQDPADDPSDPWEHEGSGQHTVEDYDRMVELVRLNPNEVADMLCEYGVDAKALREELYNRGASLHRL